MRVALSTPPCPTCRRGCTCDGSAGDPACGHYGCHGQAQATPVDRCPGTAYEDARNAALRGRFDRVRAAQQRDTARWASTYAAIVNRPLIPA